jgi:hypothetical protein
MKWSWLTALIGGALWTIHGAFEMLAPLGGAVEFSEERGYDIVVNTGVYILYGLPGTAAIGLTGAALLATARWCELPVGPAGLWGARAAYAAIGLGGLALAGVLFLFVPAFVTGIVFGGLMLGVAAGLMAFDGHEVGVNRWWIATLAAIGGFGIITLPLRPLVNAFEVLPYSAGFAVIAAFGLTWMILGYLLARSEPPAENAVDWLEERHPG